MALSSRARARCPLWPYPSFPNFLTAFASIVALSDSSKELDSWDSNLSVDVVTKIKDIFRFVQEGGAVSSPADIFEAAKVIAELRWSAFGCRWPAVVRLPRVMVAWPEEV